MDPASGSIEVLAADRIEWQSFSPDSGRRLFIDALETSRSLAEKGEARGHPAEDDLLTGGTVELSERANIAGDGDGAGISAWSRRGL